MVENIVITRDHRDPLVIATLQEVQSRKSKQPLERRIAIRGKSAGRIIAKHHFDQDDPEQAEQIITHESIHSAIENVEGHKASGGLDRLDPEFRGRILHAAKGLHGIVRKPTIILAGEAGTEHIKITPIKKGLGKKDMISTLNRKLWG